MNASEPTKLVRPGDQALATVTVAIGVDEAFRIFTQGSMLVAARAAFSQCSW